MHDVNRQLLDEREHAVPLLLLLRRAGRRPCRRRLLLEAQEGVLWHDREVEVQENRTSTTHRRSPNPPTCREPRRRSTESRAALASKALVLRMQCRMPLSSSTTACAWETVFGGSRGE